MIKSLDELYKRETIYFQVVKTVDNKIIDVQQDVIDKIVQESENL